MLLELLKDARRRSHRSQEGFTLVELLVVIAILGILAAIVLFNISGVNANAACNGMKTDGATIQGAADLYWNTYGVYPVGTSLTIVGGVATVAPSTGTELFTYKAAPPQGTVHGAIQGNACVYNP